MKTVKPAFTFDDLLLVPQYSEILPKAVNLRTFITKDIPLNIPMVSAAMDTVTEDEMAIMMALLGGVGVIHKNCDPTRQGEMVRAVKRFESGFITDPITVGPDEKVAEVIAIREGYGFKSVPVTADGTLGSPVVGMMQRNDYLSRHADLPVKERMTPLKDLLTAQGPIDLEAAVERLSESRHSKLIVLNDDGTLYALVTRRDLEKNERYPEASKDSQQRLLCAAACGPAGNMEERVETLVKAGADILVVDTAHGHSKGVIDTVSYIKKNYKSTQVIGGNIATPEAAEALNKAGADGVKVGIGPGSICTTRIIAGMGVPQLSAVMETAEYCQKHGLPVIADGGIKYSGDIAKALAAGASTVMLGSLLAGTEEAPGELIYAEGKTYKYYRGMGSLAAMTKGGKERYGQANVADQKLVPEGIEGKTLLRGPVTNEIFQLCGGVRSSMGYCGAKDIKDFQTKAVFRQITTAGLRESHPHDISILKEAPNYRG